MNGRFDDLLSRHLDEALSPAEERELLELLRDPARERRFAELCRLDREVTGLLAAPLSDDRMAELVLKDLDRPRHDSTRVLAVMAELPEERATRRRRGRLPGPRPDGTGAWAWLLPLAAAAALALVAVSLKPTTRARAARPPVPEARRPEPPAPPPAPPTPVADPPPSLPAPAPRPPAPSPLPAPRPEPAPVAPKPPPPPPAPSAIAVAEIALVEGRVEIEGAPARAGDLVRAGQGARTGPASRAELRFTDGTRIELEAESELKDVTTAGGKRAFLAAGRLTADVAHQPAGEPAVFRTPLAEGAVLGTRLRMEATAASSRLDVLEGKVRLKRLADGIAVDVAAGQTATVAPGIPFAARPLPMDEIPLQAADARRIGGDWRLVDDPEAQGGKALEALRTEKEFRVRGDKDREAVNAWYSKGMSRSYAAFTFQADGGRDYYLWVRGRTLESGPERLWHDDVMLQVVGGTFERRPADWYPYADILCPFQGYGQQPAWWWSGGAHDAGKTQTPIVVRFAKSGRQTLLMHAAEPPMRIDAIWLSTTRKTRPRADERGPAVERR